jgi:plasmid stability protein
MADVLVRNVREAAARSLKARATADRRSASAEAAQLLKECVHVANEHTSERRRYTREETIAVSKYWRERLAGRDFPDSTQLIREDRDTDHGRA